MTSITLKGIDRLDYEVAYIALRDVIATEAKHFRFLLDSTALDEEGKALYKELTARADGEYTMPQQLILTSLQMLSKLLSKHFNSKVILLIDEYDVPLDRAFQAGYYDKMVSLLRNLFGNALKTNDSLQFAVLTGCLRISKESIFTGLNNLKTHTVTDPRYDEYFGFTDEEVAEMLKYYELSRHADEIKEWYDGYRFGDVSVYCPWDVINHCDALLAAGHDSEIIPENYWANTSGNAMVSRFIDLAGQQTKDEIECLIAGESIFKPINQELTYSDIDTSIENLWSVLFTTGYLTQKGSKPAADGSRLYELVIPNREIRSLFVNQIQKGRTRQSFTASARHSRKAMPPE